MPAADQWTEYLFFKIRPKTKFEECQLLNTNKPKFVKLFLSCLKKLIYMYINIGLIFSISDHCAVALGD
jgi:hypothetical protein